MDSCIWGGAKKIIEDSGHDIKWVGDFLEDPGDLKIIELAFLEKRVLATLDKDFGELVVFRQFPHSGIIRLVNFSAQARVLTRPFKVWFVWTQISAEGFEINNYYSSFSAFIGLAIAARMT